jgi:hypothetical protein
LRRNAALLLLLVASASMASRMERGAALTSAYALISRAGSLSAESGSGPLAVWLAVIAGASGVEADSTCGARKYFIGSTTCSASCAGNCTQPPSGCSGACCCTCPAGAVCAASDAQGLQPLCSAGYYCPAGSGSPTACPAGTYGFATGAPSSEYCYQCPGGYYCLPGQQSGTMYFCPPGSYCPVGSGSPTACPAVRVLL